MAPGDLYLGSFPFGAGGGAKLRPVLLLTAAVGTVPELLVAYVSSVIPPQLMPSDIVIDPYSSEHASTNLKAVSVIRLHKLATIHQRSVVRLLGSISHSTRADVAAKLRALLGI
jgi:mRNA interferase MazF